MRRLNIISIAFVVFCSALTGCIKERHGGSGVCEPSGRYFLQVRSVDIDGNDITGSGAVSEVMLYMFDQNNIYLGKIAAAENEKTPLPYPAGTTLTIAGWGNTMGGNQNMPSDLTGLHPEDAAMTLISDAIFTGYSASPDDLFFETAPYQINKTDKDVVYTLVLERKTSEINVLVKGIKEWLSVTDNDFSVVVSETYGSLDFSSSFSGNGTKFRHALSENTTGNLATGPFRTLPSGDYVVTVDVYHANQKVYTAYADNNDEPLNLLPGRRTDVIIEFNGESVDVSVTKAIWGTETIDEEF